MVLFVVGIEGGGTPGHLLLGGGVEKSHESRGTFVFYVFDSQKHQ